MIIEIHKNMRTGQTKGRIGEDFTKTGGCG